MSSGGTRTHDLREGIPKTAFVVPMRKDRCSTAEATLDYLGAEAPKSYAFSENRRMRYAFA